MPNTSDDDNRMEEFRGLSDIPDIDDLLDFTSAETEADTYDQYIGTEVALLDTKGYMIMARVKKNSVTIIANQLEQTRIALGMINIYMR